VQQHERYHATLPRLERQACNVIAVYAMQAINPKAIEQFGFLRLKRSDALTPVLCPCPRRTVAAVLTRFPEASRPRKWAQPTGQLIAR